jgi:hypothetical protein
MRVGSNKQPEFALHHAVPSFQDRDAVSKLEVSGWRLAHRRQDRAVGSQAGRWVMQGLLGVHYAPRSGATYKEPLDILLPALMKLRHCDDSLKTLILLDSLRDILLPAKTWRKQYILRVAVKTLVKDCGAEILERCLGECERAN